MSAQKFLALVGGKMRQVAAIITSAGAADANKIIAAGPDGRLDASLLPVGVGVNTVSAVASEACGAGKFVNLYGDAGELKMRLADNSNGRPAHGFVQAEVLSAATGAVFPLDTTNAGVTGLSAGGEYWLGTAGGVIAAPLDAADDANANKINQLLGVAMSATELRTDDYGYQVL